MKKLTLPLSALLALSAAAHDVSLNEGWQFSRDDKSWTTVNVPHDWAISGPFDKKWDIQIVQIHENGEKSATEHTGRSGSLPWIGKGTYKRTFTVPAGYKRAELIFDGAMADAHVYVNGKLAGQWPYGYNAFRVDATPYLNGGENLLEVKLDNMEESSRWYPGAGIYRPVTLHCTHSDIALDSWGAFVTTAGINAGKATIDVKHRLAVANRDSQCTLAVNIVDASGNTVATSTSLPDGTGAFHDIITVDNARLWSPESPNLYKAIFTLASDGNVLDRQEVKFGIRTVAVSREHGFQLNGVTRKFKGVCLHHDLGMLGAAVNKAAIVRQLVALKEMGADAIRTSHNMPSSLQMEMCDSLGLMVMAESFDSWRDSKVKNGYNLVWDQWWDKDVTNLVLNHRNHPCIVMWSAGNEIPEQAKTEGAERYKKLIDLFHTLDPTRPVTCGTNWISGAMDSGFSIVADVPGYNYNLGSYESTIGRLRQGFILGSETASTVSSRGVYKFPDEPLNNKEWDDGQCSGYDTEACWWSNLPDDDWHMQEDFDWTIGEFVWTGYDYLGEPTPYDKFWPSRSSYFGILDLAGLPKDRYYLYRSHWNKQDHTIHLLPHWTWPGREGQVTPVYCYTDYPAAELFVNGKSQGRITKDSKSRLDRYRLRWREVKYEPGEIKVVVYDDNGNKAGEQAIKTAGKPARLVLSPESTVIDADGNDLAFVTVSLVDKNGTLCPDADDQLTFDVKGNGTFKAVCNGDATSVEVFTQPTMKLFHGQLAVAVQSTKQAGEMTLTVKDKKNGLKSSVKIQSK